MKTIFLFLTAILIWNPSFSQAENFTTAKSLSTETDRPILMIFSGSDWCKPCIQLKKEVINSAEFQSFAEANVILFEVDFPYRKANRLPKDKQAANDQLAAQFNPEGVFPKVVLLNQDGKVLGNLNSRTKENLKKEIEVLTASKI